MRTFLAISLPDQVRAQLARVQALVPVGRRVDPDGLHLTIAFLGEQSDQTLDEVHLSMQGLRAPAPEVRVTGLDLFGGAEPRILFAAVAANAQLDDLHKRVKARLHAAGLDLPRERFRPHVTLARLGAHLTADEAARLARFLQTYGATEASAFTASTLALYESVRGKAGNSYQVLAEYPLGI